MDDDNPTIFIRSSPRFRMKTTEIERGVAFRTLPKVYETQTLEEEKKNLNDLNTRLEMLVEMLKTKKAENEILEKEIRNYKENFQPSSTIVNASQLGFDLSNARKGLNDLSNDNTIKKIRLTRNIRDLDLLKEKINQEAELQSNDKNRIKILEAQAEETQEDVYNLKERLQMKEESVTSSIEKNWSLLHEYNKLVDGLDASIRDRVFLEIDIQSLNEKKNFENELFRLMKAELEKLHLIDNDGKKFIDFERFYETELRSIRDKIRDDYLKINEYNNEAVRHEYEHRYTKIVEEIETHEATVLATNHLAEEEALKELNAESSKNKQELNDLKNREDELKRVLDDLLTRLNSYQSKFKEDKDIRDSQIAELDEQLRQIKSDSWSLLNFSKHLDSEISIYDRLLNKRFDKYLTDMTMLGTQPTDFSVEEYKKTFFSAKKAEVKPRDRQSYVAIEETTSETIKYKINVIDQELLELRKHQDEFERMRRERREKEEKEKLRRLKEEEAEREKLKKLQEQQELERQRRLKEEEEQRERDRLRRLKEEEDERERIRKLREQQELDRQRILKEEEEQRERARLQRLKEEGEERERIRKIQEQMELERQRREDEDKERIRKQREQQEIERQRRLKEEEEQRERARLQRLKEEDEERDRIRKQREQQELEKQRRLKEEEDKRERERLQRLKEAEDEKERIRKIHEQQKELERKRREDEERIRKQREQQELERQRRLKEEEEQRERARLQKLKEEEEEKERIRKIQEQHELERQRRQNELEKKQELERQRQLEEERKKKESEEIEVTIDFQKEAKKIQNKNLIPARVKISEGSAAYEVQSKSGTQVERYHFEQRVQVEIEEIEKIRRDRDEEFKKAAKLQVVDGVQPHEVKVRTIGDKTIVINKKSERYRLESNSQDHQNSTASNRFQIEVTDPSSQIIVKPNSVIETYYREEHKTRQEQEEIIRQKLYQIEYENQQQHLVEIEKQNQIDKAEHELRLKREHETRVLLEILEEERQKKIDIERSKKIEREKSDHDTRLKLEIENMERDQRLWQHQQQEEQRLWQQQQEEQRLWHEQQQRMFEEEQHRLKLIDEERRMKQQKVYEEEQLRLLEEERRRQIEETTTKTVVKTNETIETTNKQHQQRRHGQVDNYVDHCVSSSSGRKHILILQNPIEIRTNKKDDGNNKLSKYALKHKANRYVSGAIGILETSINGEYVVLENLSSTKTVNLNGWYLHRFVPDQSINVLYKFINDICLKSGDKLRVWSKGSLSKLTSTPGFLDTVANDIENWGVYSKYSVTKLINTDGIDKAVLTQTLLRLSTASSNITMLKPATTPIKQDTVEYLNTKTTNIQTTTTTTTTTSLSNTDKQNQKIYQSNYITGF